MRARPKREYWSLTPVYLSSIGVDEQRLAIAGKYDDRYIYSYMDMISGISDARIRWTFQPGKREMIIKSCILNCAELSNLKERCQAGAMKTFVIAQLEQINQANRKGMSVLMEEGDASVFGYYAQFKVEDVRSDGKPPMLEDIRRFHEMAWTEAERSFMELYQIALRLDSGN